MALRGGAGHASITALADGHQGMDRNGPARDPDRVAGNADRPRSRRASARRAATATDPDPGHSLALNPASASPSGTAATEERRRPQVSLLLPRPTSHLPKRRRPPPYRRRFGVFRPAGRARSGSPSSWRDYVMSRNAPPARAHAVVITPGLPCSPSRSTGPECQENGDRAHGQPAGQPSGRGPGPSWVSRRGVPVQGRPHRLSSPRRLLRLLGAAARRDRQPRHRTGARLAPSNPFIIGRLTRTLSDWLQLKNNRTRQPKNNRRRSTRDDRPPHERAVVSIPAADRVGVGARPRRRDGRGRRGAGIAAGRVPVVARLSLIERRRVVFGPSFAGVGR